MIGFFLQGLLMAGELKPFILDNPPLELLRSVSAATLYRLDENRFVIRLDETAQKRLWEAGAGMAPYGPVHKNPAQIAVDSPQPFLILFFDDIDRTDAEALLESMKIDYRCEAYETDRLCSVTLDGEQWAKLTQSDWLFALYPDTPPMKLYP